MLRFFCFTFMFKAGFHYQLFAPATVCFTSFSRARTSLKGCPNKEILALTGCSSEFS